MSLETLATRFVEMCNQGKYFDVMELMYAPDIVSVEADGRQVHGKGPVIQKSRDWQAANAIHGGHVRGPFFERTTTAGADTSGQFACLFSVDVTPKSTSRRVTLEEVGIYTVKDEQITLEQFYYDGAR
jgi:hypothetical protein